MGKVQLIAIIFNSVLLLAVILLLKRGSLKERYSILWILGFSALLILSISRKLLEKTATFFGVHYPPSFLFLLAFFVTIIMLLHFSIVISGLEKKYKILSQKMVLLEEKLNRLLNGKKDKNS